MPSKVWDEITYAFPNFNDFTVEVWEWISNFITLIHFVIDVITYPSSRNDMENKCIFISLQNNTNNNGVQLL